MFVIVGYNVIGYATNLGFPLGYIVFVIDMF